MLPAGEYRVKLVTVNAHRREIRILNKTQVLWSENDVNWTIGAATSWVDCKKNHTVGVGLPLKPGIVFKSQPEYRNVVKHVEKGDRRNDGIDLCIVDECERQLPIVHWLKTPDHGCPKTIRRIEACEDGAVDIYEGERLVRHVTAEELELKQSKTINTEEV